jgi:hypothetical protein
VNGAFKKANTCGKGGDGFCDPFMGGRAATGAKSCAGISF